MPTALIAEDEPLLADALASGLRRCWPELNLLPHAQDGDEAVELALQLRPDLVFLDIRMPGRSGLEAAQAIVEDWPAGVALPLLVFVTAYDQYALQAFDACAVDYLLKPVQPARLATACARLKTWLTPASGARPPAAAGQPTALDLDETSLQRLRALLAATWPSAAPGPHAVPRLTVIQASVGHAVHLVPVDDVLYFEAADKYLRVVTAEREYLIRCALRELLTQLDEQVFWQIHRGTVVRATAIAQAQRDEAGKVHLLLRGRPERLPVSRIYALRFKGM